MIARMFLCLAVLLEGGVLPLLLFHEQYHGDWKGLLLLHGLTSIAVGLLGWDSLPRTYRRNPIVVILFFTVLSLFIPMLGAIGVLALVLLTHFTTVKKDHAQIQELPDSYFSGTGNLDFSQYGRGDLHSRFQTAALRTEARLDALGKLQGFETHQIRSTVRQALQDQTDDVRLVAFGILDKKEKSINERINRELEWYQQCRENQEKLTHARELAYAYWELVYKDVVEGDILLYALGKAEYYNTVVLTARPSDAGMWALKGQILLRAHRSEEAHTAFTNARDHGIPDTRVLPYLAELAFLRKDFSELSGLFQRGQRLSEVPVLKPVIRYWTSMPTPAPETMVLSSHPDSHSARV